MIQLLLFDEEGYCNAQRLTELETLINRAAQRMGLLQSWPDGGWLSLALVDSEAMAVANETFLEHEGPTDVLTFDYRDDADNQSTRGGNQGETVQAELLVCPEVAARQGKTYGHEFAEEVFLYIIHGLLHLAGSQDRQPAERQQMAEQQDAVLAEVAGDTDLGTIFRNLV